MESLEIFLADLRFRLMSLDALGWLDLILVTAVLLILILALLRSRAAFLLRGGLLLVLFSLIGTLFLPLPTFDWIMRAAFLIILNRPIPNNNCFLLIRARLFYIILLPTRTIPTSDLFAPMWIILSFTNVVDTCLKSLHIGIMDVLFYVLIGALLSLEFTNVIERVWCADVG